jgi:hypothetical protein
MKTISAKDKRAGIELTDTIIEAIDELGPRVVLSAVLTAIATCEGDGVEMTAELQSMHEILTTRGMLGLWIF